MKDRETRKFSETVHPKRWRERWDNSEHEFQEALAERDVTRAMRILRDVAEDLLQAE